MVRALASLVAAESLNCFANMLDGDALSAFFDTALDQFSATVRAHALHKAVLALALYFLGFEGHLLHSLRIIPGFEQNWNLWGDLGDEGMIRDN